VRLRGAVRSRGAVRAARLGGPSRL
jgi:hypothetical protein